MTVQEIITAVSIDVRNVLGGTGTDANLMIGWVDRIHKDCLHTSIYSHVNQSSTTQALTAGTGSYTLGVSDIRRVTSVYDRTFNRVILPFDEAFAPQTTAQQVMPPAGGPPMAEPKQLVAAKTAGPFVDYYRVIGTNTLVVYPTPATSTYASSLEVQYEKQVTTLTALSDTLIIPNDGKDMVVAGVNAVALTYLKVLDEAALWGQTYEKLKRGDITV